MRIASLPFDEIVARLAFVLPEKLGGGLGLHLRDWLIQVASQRMADHLHSELPRRRREAFAAIQVRPETDFAWWGS